MTKAISTSSDGLPTPEPGATDSLWQPSWLHWLISALSGTVETEKQTAWLKKNNEELRKSNEELRKSNEEARMRHEEWLKNEQKLSEERKKKNEEARMRHEEWLRNEQQKTEELRQENARLAELESKLDAVLHRSDSSSNPMKPTDKD